MRILYKIFTKFYTLLIDQVFLVRRTWMFFLLRGGRLGSTNQGWSRVKSFLQETVDKFFQHSPRNGDRPKQKSQVQDARVLLTDLPTFFFIFATSLVFIFSTNSHAEVKMLHNSRMFSLDSQTQRKEQLKLDSDLNKNLNSNEITNSNEISSTSNSKSKLNSHVNPEIQNQNNAYKSQQNKIKKKMRDVAELYEKQFLREMVKQMRATVPSTDMFKSSFAETYYREQLDQQYVETWGDRGGIGMGDLIYKELVQKYGSRMGLSSDDDKVEPQISHPQ